MTRHSLPFNPTSGISVIALVVLTVLLALASTSVAFAQTGSDEKLALKVQQLTDAMNETQKQLERSQLELQQLRTQLTALQDQIASFHANESASSSASELNAAVEQIREQQSVQETQIATHEQAKVESESKYPVKLSGLVLLTGFVNTTRVDNPTVPTVALGGGGSTGISLQQTVLGFDARGPHLWSARSHADARVDFFGTGSANAAGGNTYASGLLRLRTAHAALDWEHAQAFFSLDHPIVAPNTPASLTAVAVPALAWSGNLWTWNPELGASADAPFSKSQRMRFQAALIDITNSPQIYNVTGVGTGNVSPTTAELSRWPGAEGRVAYLHGPTETGFQIGLGGVFSPHRTAGGAKFNSWAGTLDYRIPLPGRTEITGSAYSGQALGGLGGGAYKDYVYNYDPILGYSYRTLHGFGGWTQLSEHLSERLEFNFAFGTDQVSAAQLRPYAGPASAYYLNLARNRTFTGNVIYRPSAYLLFSMEYRHIQSSPVNDYTATGDVIGIATGYRF